MVVRLVPPPVVGAFEGLESVIQGVIAGGAPEPSWVAVDDGSERWAAMAAVRPFVERSAGVVAAASEQSLLTAQKLGIGGAMWLPPAYLGAMDAFEAANAMPRAIRDFDSDFVELLEHGSPIQLVTVAELGFWRTQLGDRALRHLLTELAEAIDRPAAILPWPAAVVVGEGVGDISGAWNDLSAARLVRCPDLAIASLVVDPGETGVLECVYRRLVEGVPKAGQFDTQWQEPVHELPSGRQVGWWSPRSCDESLEDGLWCAVPVSVGKSRCSWEVRRSSNVITLHEVLESGEGDRPAGVTALRVPGWAARELGQGTPAGLLAMRLADAATSLDLPLWIPGVDQKSLRFVLGLPGTIWIDGPAVPKQDV